MTAFHNYEISDFNLEYQNSNNTNPCIEMYTPNVYTTTNTTNNNYQQQLENIAKIYKKRQEQEQEESIVQKGYMKTDDHLRIMNQRIKEHEEKEKKYQNDIKNLQNEILYLQKCMNTYIDNEQYKKCELF